MRVLFDTNVVLDVLLRREPHAAPAARLLSLVERGRIEGLLGATTITTLSYLASRAVGPRRARRYVQSLLAFFDVAPVGRAVLVQALEIGFEDYEDAVLHESARLADAVGLVTRNPVGFKRATLRVYAPAELLLVVAAAGGDG